MKPSAYVIGVLLIALITTSIGIVLTGFNSSYSDAAVVNDSFLDNYDFSEDINSTMSPIVDDVKNIGQDSGLFFISGGVTFIKAVANGFKVITQSLWFGFDIISRAGDSIGIPPSITAILVIILLVSLIFGLLSALHRYKV